MRYRLDRALRILQLLQDGKYDPVGLTIELGVNRRTVYRDIALLKEMGIEIEFDTQASSYVVRSSRSGRVDPRELQLALSHAMQHSTISVEAIIREVALVLAGASEPRNPEPRNPEPETTAGEPIPGAPDADVTDGTPERPEEDLDGLAADLSSTSISSETVRIDSSLKFYWTRTGDSLTGLYRAIQSRSKIETSESILVGSGAVAARTFRLVPVEFTVDRDGVVVVGTDARGKQIRARSSSVRLAEKELPDRVAQESASK